MNKTYALIAIVFPGIMLAASKDKEKTDIRLISSTPQSTIIEFIPGNFSFKPVTTPNGSANTLIMDNGTALLHDGAPDLLKLHKSLIIPDNGSMDVTVVSSTYYDLQNIEIAPSKGNVKRNVEINNLPYSYGSVYQKNEFFPSRLTELRSPYILRDFRAQTVLVYPFQYNPVSKVLRVYTGITVKVSVKTLSGGENEFTRTNVGTPIDAEFDAIYKKQFINYNTPSVAKTQYTPIAENGSMLIICYDSFEADMQPFVNWKNQKGIATTLVKKSVAGANAAAIKTYITTYYNAHPTLKYVLLVGDAPQVPASSTSNGDSDNNYGYITGNDSYAELFIGRFSATTSTQVQTMVNRCLSYEKTPSTTATWYKTGIAIGSDQGPGDNNEYDWQHQRLIRSKLLAYNYNGSGTYTTVNENYDGSQGGADASGNPTASMIATQVNNGAGIITYTGHGGDMEFVTTGFSVTNINSLTNSDKWPFVWAVACVNGNFVANATCFAEAWLRAGTPAQPKGAIATFMSTINQSWDPPMRGQDAMVGILVESVSGNIKRTFAGLSMNGCMDMNDAYGSQGAEMTDTWTTFGDPSVMVYTRTPAALTANHISSTAVGVTSVAVNCNTNGALICLSMNGVILGTGTVVNGVATITFPAVTNAGTINVTATAYDMAPYAGTINVTSGANGVADYTTSAQFGIFPVPAQNDLFINLQLFHAEKIKLGIYNGLGQEVMSVINNRDMNAGNYTETVDVSKLASGVYICRLQSNGADISKRIVISNQR